MKLVLILPRFPLMKRSNTRLAGLYMTMTIRGTRPPLIMSSGLLASNTMLALPPLESLDYRQLLLLDHGRCKMAEQGSIRLL
jgi:hypothetical protein